MRVPLEWLADYVRLDRPLDDLVQLLTLSGLNVESVEQLGAAWDDVMVAQVTELEEHPSSRNPLWVATVQAVDGPVTIVTGAPNLTVGDRVPFVAVGGRIPVGPDGGPLTIEARPMAGVTSHGMLASARELGISDEHTGIYILPPDAPLGAPLRDVLGSTVLDLEILINRPDTLAMVGVGREVAALTNQVLTLPQPPDRPERVVDINEDSIPVTIEDFELCPRYTALRIEGEWQAASPGWLRRRLEAAGMRPISLLVDLTNYVMLELGQPMHAFDASKLAGNHIIVRLARAGERLTTLDGEERELSTEDLVIADESGPIGIAGVMGGENTEIGPDTSAVILESATFEPIRVRRTAQRHALRTEASSRFEKGLAPETAPLAARRYVELLAQITGGPVKVARMSDRWVGPSPERIVRMPGRDLRRLVGMPIDLQTAAEKLSALGFGVERAEDALAVRVPYWRRVDIQQSADVVEEVARMVGYDKLPLSLPRRTLPPSRPSETEQGYDLIRRRLLAAGVSEVVTDTLTSIDRMARLDRQRSAQSAGEEWERLVVNPEGVRQHHALVQPLVLANPATQERSVLRLSLISGLLGVVSRNLKHTSERVAFFELGTTFFSRGPEELPYERRTLGIALSGSRIARSWQEPSPPAYSFFDLKGILEAVFESLRLAAWQCVPGQHPALHPGRSATVLAGDRPAALLGELHPEVAAAFEIEGWPALVAEVDVDAIFAQPPLDLSFTGLPRFPSALRDLAVVIPEATPADEVLRVVRAAGGSLIDSARIFDVYRGDPLAAGQKSVAIELELRSGDATLTQEEIVPLMEGVVEALRAELGGVLRE